MTKTIIAFAALAALAACAATASPAVGNTLAVNAATLDGTACAVHLTQTNHGLRIEALARAPHAFSGEYDLVVGKAGPNGASDITQGGPFEASAGEQVTLSAAEFNIERGDRYHARLVVREDGAEVCRDEQRS